MKRALRKDSLREIRRNPGRFISIFFIIALGAAFFTGIRSAKYDMKYSADLYYNSASLMDMRVLSDFRADRRRSGSFAAGRRCESGRRQLYCGSNL